MNSVNLNELAMVAAGNSTGLITIIEKEIIHYDILSTMNQKGYLNHLTFQGGTSLRLCYGSERLSEDLDFTGGKQFKQETMMNLKADIEASLQAKYGLAVTVKPPKEVDSNEGIQVSAWQVSVVTMPKDKSIPQQRVKIEVANVPSYTREVRAVRNNYPDLPMDDVIVGVQSLEEIMADKLLAFPISRNIRYRDIWDLTFMSRRNVQPNIDLLKSKISDYGVEGYQEGLHSRTEELHDIIESNEFHTQMQRFLPLEVVGNLVGSRNIREAMYNTVNDLFTEIDRSLRSPKLK